MRLHISVVIAAVLACRPLAFSHGATDELTHSLGHSRVHLGLNMAATAIPNSEATEQVPEDVVLYFGIIDLLQVSQNWDQQQLQLSLAKHCGP